MSELTPITKDQLFEKKIAENTGSNYNVGDISDVIPVTKDQALLKEIALNSAGQSGAITELEERVEEIDGKVTKIIGADLYDYSFDFSSQYSDKFSFIINFWNTSSNHDHVGCIIGLVLSNHKPVIMFSNVPTVESYSITISGTTLTIAKTYQWAGMDIDALLF